MEYPVFVQYVLKNRRKLRNLLFQVWSFLFSVGYIAFEVLIITWLRSSIKKSNISSVPDRIDRFDDNTVNKLEGEFIWKLAAVDEKYSFTWKQKGSLIRCIIISLTNQYDGRLWGIKPSFLHVVYWFLTKTLYDLFWHAWMIIVERKYSEGQNYGLNEFLRLCNFKDKFRKRSIFVLKLWYFDIYCSRAVHYATIQFFDGTTVLASITKANAKRDYSVCWVIY